MKKLKSFLFPLLVLSIALSCRDDDWAPYPDMNENVGAATILTRSTDPARNRFNASSIASQFVEFNLNVDGYELTTVSEVELQITFFEASPVRTVGPLLLKKLNSFPSAVTISSQEAAAAIGGGFTVNDFQSGDSFRLTFPILTSDGRRLTVALNSQLCTEPAQPLFGSCQYQWSVVP
jgi:hypothetical protein